MSEKFSRLILMLCLIASPLFGQVDVSTATLKGSVYDPNQAVIPGAAITVTNIDRMISKDVAAAADGSYLVPLLPPGAYRVEVQAEGFDKAVIQRVELTIGQMAILDFHLQIGSVKSEVVVNESAPLIEVEKTQQANTLGSLEIANLPNISRNFTDSVFTLPGVSSSDAPRAQFPGYTGFLSSGFSIGGSNGRNNLVTFDGGENDYGSGQLRTPNISVESVQEFQVNRSAFAAEFGFTSGTAINVITKSGGNQFHGSAYAFFRDQHTQARNFFDTNSTQPFDQNFFPGFTLGGPILHSKLFFFTSYEFRKGDTPQFRNYINTPEALGINVNPAQLSYVNQLASSSDPTLQGLAGFFKQALLPLNNPAVVSLLGANTGVFNDTTRSHDWVTRVDYQPGDKDTLTARFSLERWNYSTIGGSTLYAASDASNTSSRDYTLLGTWNHIFNAQLVNQLRVQVVPSNMAATLPFNPGSTELSIGDLGVFNQSYTAPYAATQRRFQFEDNLTWSRGNHTLKFGASYRPVHYQVQNNLWFGGEFDFFEGTLPLISLVPASAQGALVGFNLQNGYPATGPAATNLSALESFSFGLPVAYRQGFNNPLWQSWANYMGAFAQDSWKMTPKLTLSYGVRLDYDAEPSPVPHNVYFSPRLGFAWDPFGNQKTVIRAGSGIFVAPVNFQISYLTNLLNDSGKYINQVLTGDSTSVLWPLPGGFVRWSFQLPGYTDRHAEELKDKLFAAGFGYFPTKRVKDRGIQTGSGEMPLLGFEHLTQLLTERAPWFNGSIGELTWRTLVRFEQRQTNCFGQGRIWLAGDAAHVTLPAGVRSMNLGLFEGHDLAVVLSRILTSGSSATRDLKTYNDRWMAEWTHSVLRKRSDTDSWVAENLDRLLPCIPGHGEELSRLAGQLGLDVERASCIAGR